MTTDLWNYRDSALGDDLDMSGYQVVGRDGAIGSVSSATNAADASFVIVEATETDSKRKVMLPAYTVEQVDPHERTITIDRSREEVAQAPGFASKDTDGDEDSGSLTDEVRERLTGFYHGIYTTGL